MSPSRSLAFALAAMLVSPVLVGTATTSASGAHRAADRAGAAEVSARVAARARQRATLVMHPQIADPGRRVRKAAWAKSAMTAEIKPARTGRVARLQRKQGRRWVTVKKSRTNGAGRIDFTAAYKVRGRIPTYRVLAARHRGYGSKASKGVRTNRWGGADFSDEFNGTALASAWGHRLQGRSAESKRKCSRADSSAVRVAGGTLRLNVLEEKLADKPLTPLVDESRARCRHDGRDYRYRLNANVGTEGAKAFRYGYAAARIKGQPRAGQHAAFWMQPDTINRSGRGEGAEIDVIEWFGVRNDDHDKELASFVYKDQQFGGLIKKNRRYGRDWQSTYHVFSVEWTPSRYVFRIDGKETFRTSRGVSKREQYLILSTLSSDYELKFLKREAELGSSKTTAHVDWVRYWKR